ncbi:DALR anticodon-binding domain-containing protein [Sphaerospermopsis aphanizomenoides]|uniref:DALR anticodon-binding domain-containing protein n=1 Tax=Sphaerospermopsis aphanizomenoides TaxID=459663 RepID=UPI001F3DC8B2|nr:DALR anticodon-binding domain-containing protein [Sphaerospermopsis aphanizomenoides]
MGLRISASRHPQALEIVQELATYLSANCGDIFSSQIISPHWIHLELTDSALGSWLHNLTVDSSGLEGVQEEMGRRGDGENNISLSTSCLLSPVKSHLSPSSSFLRNKQILFFTIQYAHARCCSLLRLAHQEGLIQLIDNSAGVQCFLSARAIPWLNSDQKFRLQQPEEIRLIHQLVKMVDDLIFPDVHSAVNWEKAGLKLSQAFESFWCHCRIWGEVKMNFWELAQARLGLLIATQVVLRAVLETKLGVLAPVEL